MGEVLHPTGHDGVGLTEFDHLCTGNNRLNARAADTGQRKHGHFLRNARLQPGMACPVDGLRTGLERIAHHDVVNGLGGRSGFFEGTLNGGCTQVLCADGLQCATGFAVASLSANPFTKRCACTANNDHFVAHGCLESNEGYESHSSMPWAIRFTAGRCC